MTISRRERRHSELDADRSVDLDDVGAPGYTAGVAVTSDGTEEYVLAYRGHLNDDDARYPSHELAWQHIAPHELTGRLPRQWARTRGLLTCGRRSTATGKPCRNIVDHAGDACMWHDGTQHE